MSHLDCMAVLKALSDLNRLRITRLLLKNQLGVNAIAERLQLTQYNVSKQLKILRDAGLLDMEKKGQQRLYGVAEHFKNRLAANNNELRLECCVFQFDKLPK